jgi:hypothetical protein
LVRERGASGAIGREFDRVETSRQPPIFGADHDWRIVSDWRDVRNSAIRVGAVKKSLTVGRSSTRPAGPVSVPRLLVRRSPNMRTSRGPELTVVNSLRHACDRLDHVELNESVTLTGKRDFNRSEVWEHVFAEQAIRITRILAGSVSCCERSSLANDRRGCLRQTQRRAPPVPPSVAHSRTSRL